MNARFDAGRPESMKFCALAKQQVLKFGSLTRDLIGSWLHNKKKQCFRQR